MQETKDDQIDRRAFFSLWVIRVFAKFYYFCVHCLFSSQETNSKQSVTHILKRNCLNYLGIIYCCAISPSLKSLSLALKAINRIQDCFCEYLLWVKANEVNYFAVSSQRVHRSERRLNICKPSKERLGHERITSLVGK